MSEKQKEILEKFENIRCSTVGGKRRPSKPLLILLALGMIAAGDKPRLNGYSEIKPKLQRLLDKYGLPNETHDPNNPFVHLEPALWEVRKNQSSRPRDRVGGFADCIHAEFLADPSFIMKVALAVLEKAFPASLHEIIIKDEDIRLDSLGYAPSLVWQPRRDPTFAKRVLRAYDNKCAVCSYDLRLGNNILGIDAAHIQWHSCNGPDEVSNGLALCKIHHTALDSGAIGVDGDFRILVSTKLDGTAEIQNWLFQQFDNQSLNQPEKSEHQPNLKYLEWHYKQVFKGMR